MKEYPPQMHSAEHILNQTMVRIFNKGRSFSAHIEKKKSKCDYHFDRNLTEEEVAEIENRVNKVIEDDLSISEEIYSHEEAEQIVSLEKLPEGAGDSVRVIRIGDYDICPCRGQHVNSTKEIGGFKIISTGFEDGVLRIRFKLEQKGNE